jgi:endonuclease/exonuclease/phosphatase family metal-dependent hydrolase
MQFRVVTLNLEQNHKRWTGRQSLISAETAALRPDVIAFNEVSVPLQTARTLRDSATAMTGVPYNLVQQTRVNGLSKVEGEALLTRFPVVETGNLDYQTRDIVALVARVPIGEAPVDIYVTHRRTLGCRGVNRMRRLQCRARRTFRRSDGYPLPADADGGDRLHTTRRQRRRGVAPLLAPHGPLHRLYLGVRRDRGTRQRSVLRPAEPG